MKNYYVLWTYVANYSSIPLEIPAKDAEEAADKVRAFYSEDFRKKAKVYVFEAPPAYVHDGQQFC